MQASAVTKYIRMSTIKIDRVLRLVRGMRADLALSKLHFMRKNAAEPIAKTLRSAIANLGNLEEGQRIDLDAIIVKSAFVAQGPTLKRFRPMSMGRAGKIRKRTTHLTIVVEDKK